VVYTREGSNIKSKGDFNPKLHKTEVYKTPYRSESTLVLKGSIFSLILSCSHHNVRDHRKENIHKEGKPRQEG